MRPVPHRNRRRAAAGLAACGAAAGRGVAGRTVGAVLLGVRVVGRRAEQLRLPVATLRAAGILPVRRAGLLSAAPGTEITVVVAWVLVPSLTVQAAEQTYTVLGRGRVRFASGRFTADLTLDQDGFVEAYPGLATSV